MNNCFRGSSPEKRLSKHKCMSHTNTNLLITQSSQVSYFLPRSRYFPRHLLLKQMDYHYYYYYYYYYY